MGMIVAFIDSSSRFARISRSAEPMVFKAGKEEPTALQLDPLSSPESFSRRLLSVIFMRFRAIQMAAGCLSACDMSSFDYMTHSPGAEIHTCPYCPSSCFGFHLHMLFEEESSKCCIIVAFCCQTPSPGFDAHCFCFCSPLSKVVLLALLGWLPSMPSLIPLVFTCCLCWSFWGIFACECSLRRS